MTTLLALKVSQDVVNLFCVNSFLDTGFKFLETYLAIKFLDAKMSTFKMTFEITYFFVDPLTSIYWTAKVSYWPAGVVFIFFRMGVQGMWQDLYKSVKLLQAKYTSDSVVVIPEHRHASLLTVVPFQNTFVPKSHSTICTFMF